MMETLTTISMASIPVDRKPDDSDPMARTFWRLDGRNPTTEDRNKKLGPTAKSAGALAVIYAVSQKEGPHYRTPNLN